MKHDEDDAAAYGSGDLSPPLSFVATTPTGRVHVRYLLVGAFNTAFGFGLFALLLILAGNQVHYLVILVVATIVAVLVAFTGYRTFVFSVRGSVLKDLCRFSIVYVVALAVNVVALPVLVEALGVPVLLAQAFIVTGTVVASFFAHRRFSFRRPTGEARR